MPKPAIRPKWLDEEFRDTRTSSADSKYIANMKRTVRIIAAEIWLQRGGNDPQEIALREAYSGSQGIPRNER
jgi:hypothetical protein